MIKAKFVSFDLSFKITHIFKDSKAFKVFISNEELPFISSLFRMPDWRATFILSLFAQNGNRPFVVVLDAGHGGKDTRVTSQEWILRETYCAQHYQSHWKAIGEKEAQ